MAWRAGSLFGLPDMRLRLRLTQSAAVHRGMGRGPALAGTSGSAPRPAACREYRPRSRAQNDMTTFVLIHDA